MKLLAPFAISSRLSPALQIGKAWISFCAGRFIIDLPDGSSHIVRDFRFPAGRIAGETDCDVLQSGFASLLSFLGACAESRAYGTRKNGDPMSGENSDLFPPYVGEWAESVSDEIGMLAFEIESTRGLLSE